LSYQTESLLGLILAIGIVVDDAIVVVEGVEHIMETEKLSPYEATKKAMNGLGKCLDCHFIGIGCRVRACQFLERNYRTVISSVYSDDCSIRAHFHGCSFDIESRSCVL